MFDDHIIHTERLTVPHPRIAERTFVLKPLLDLAPSLHLSSGEAIADVLAALDADGLWPLEPQ